MKIRYSGLVKSGRNRMMRTFAEIEIIPEYLETLVETLQIKRVKNYLLARAGNLSDGGYVMLRDLKPDGIAYSFGINNDVSWDDAVAGCGYQIFMYDMTINDLPKHRLEFHFFKEGISGKKDPINRLDTLENFLERNGHQNQRNMILKMDVEGAEWDFLETVKSETLAQFDQIVFEFHSLAIGVDLVKSGMIISRLQKLNLTHQVVHIHGNNASGATIIFENALYPELLEVTYVNRANYEFEDAEIILPNPNIDAPNLPDRRELILGNWNARFKNS